jgi:hypothetical protein
MALKRLTTEEMSQVSAPLVATDSPPRTVIDKFPTLTALLPQLQSAHKGVLAMRRQVENPKLQELSDREASLDADHDDRVRGIYGALTGLALVSGAGPELTQLRDILFPEGLAHTQKTYRGEAGHAAMVASHLDANTQARFKAVNLHDVNLLDLVNSWLGVAEQLGKLEDERARLTPAPNTAAEVNNARLSWVRIMNAFVANAELADLDEDSDRLLFGPLRAAEQTADTRGRGKNAPAPVPGPVPDPVAPANETTRDDAAQGAGFSLLKPRSRQGANPGRALETAEAWSDEVGLAVWNHGEGGHQEAAAWFGKTPGSVTRGSWHGLKTQRGRSRGARPRFGHRHGG